MRFRLNPSTTLRRGPVRVHISRNGIRPSVHVGRVSASAGRRGPSLSVRVLRGLRATLGR